MLAEGMLMHARRPNGRAKRLTNGRAKRLRFVAVREGAGR
jgi:hypothetical protein